MADDDGGLGGRARCPGPGWADLMASDTVEPPGFLKRDSYEFMGSAPLRADRYTSADFFRRELEAMWPNVWQFAAREEELPEPGDFACTRTGPLLFLVPPARRRRARVPQRVPAPRPQAQDPGSAGRTSCKCPFHGFAWNMDGSLKHIPCRWDFPHLTTQAMRLPEARGRSLGRLYLRQDAEAALRWRSILAPLPEHFQRWRHEECVTAIWVGKVIHANWKATAEAFMEAWHSVVTHPQILPFTGDANTALRCLRRQCERRPDPFASPRRISPTTRREQWIVDEFLKYNGRAGGDDLSTVAPCPTA